MIQYDADSINNDVSDSTERNFLRSLVGIDKRTEEYVDGKAWENALYELDVPEYSTDDDAVRVLRAWAYDHMHCLSVGENTLVERKHAENIFTSFGNKMYVLDGTILDTELGKDLIYVVVGFYKRGDYPNFSRILSATQNNEELTLSFSSRSYYSSDDGLREGCVVLELDKASLKGDITAVNTKYTGKLFDLHFTRNSDGEKIEETSFWNEKVTACERMFFKVRDWSAWMPECEFDYTIEIIEKVIVGYGDEEHYAMPIYEFTGEKRTLLYNSELGVCVEDDRSLTLNEEDKALINSFID
jgi:hypothetical protein